MCQIFSIWLGFSGHSLLNRVWFSTLVLTELGMLLTSTKALHNLCLGQLCQRVAKITEFGHKEEF